MKSSTIRLGMIGLLAVVFSSLSGRAAESALGQLQKAANGTVHTGVTFDGSPRTQQRAPADTHVQSNGAVSSAPAAPKPQSAAPAPSAPTQSTAPKRK